jgi:copper chaperone CopZ
VSVAVKKVNGVRSVDVSLKDGKAAIRFTPTSTGKYGDVRGGIEKNGFVVREAQMRVRGKVHKGVAGMQFIVSGSGETFQILPTGDLAQTLNQNAEREIVIDATVPTPEKNRYQDKLLIKQIIAAEKP